MEEGGCHCGAIRYRLAGHPLHHALCHCEDCRRTSGAPLVGWAMFAADALTVTAGEPVEYHSSEHGRRQFCGKCGTGLFYVNEKMLPGMVDVQSATLDNPLAYAPSAQIQVAERLDYMADLSALPVFDRYPGP